MSMSVWCETVKEFLKIKNFSPKVSSTSQNKGKMWLFKGNKKQKPFLCVCICVHVSNKTHLLKQGHVTYLRDVT